MVYFLGRDVKVAMSTEQEAFGLKMASGTLDITGTSSSAAADTDQIPPRVNGLLTGSVTGVAEITDITILARPNGINLESVATGGNKYIHIYDPDGDVYSISFNDVAAGTYAIPDDDGITTTDTLKVNLVASTTVEGTLVSGDATVTVASTAALHEGMRVTSTNIPTASFVYILSITDATHYEMTANAGGNATEDITYTVDDRNGVAGALRKAINDDTTGLGLVATATTGQGSSNVVRLTFDQKAGATGLSDSTVAVAKGAGFAAFTDATCDYNNDPTITHDANALIITGLGVSGTGIPANAVVGTVTDGTHFELLNGLTGAALSTTGGAVTNGTLTFSRIDVATITEGVTADNFIPDVTGLDITYGATDEDITFFGQNTALKAELKKETTVTLTKKKGTGKHDIFPYLFNQARCGIRHTSNTIDADAGTADASLEFDSSLNIPTAKSGGSNFGYRVFVQLKSGSEVLTIRNLCITEYGTSLSADGVQEETVTLYSNVLPVIGTTSNTDITTQDDF